MAPSALFDPSDPDFLIDPYATYRRLLREAPLFQLPKDFLERSPSTTDWCVSRHEDVSMALKDRRFVREWKNAAPKEAIGVQTESAVPPLQEQFFAGMNRMMLFRDPPDHTRLRGLVNKAFTPAAVSSLRPKISELVTYLLKDLMSSSDSADLISGFALPLPVMVIAEMLGVSVADRSQFKRWSVAVARSLDATQTDKQIIQEAAEAYRDLASYLQDTIDDHRRHPREDILTNLIRAEEEGERLSEDELLSTCILLLIAGHETTTNLIGNGFWTLHNHPGARAELKNNPEIVQSAVEEILRFEPPVQRTMRFVSQPVEMGGVHLEQGHGVYLLLAAANRDPAVFSNPDTFDIQRDNNRHLSFATGTHFCLGAPLARLEGQIALKALAQSELECSVDTPEWRNLTVFRGLSQLPVRPK